jgi:hypothetical protein
VISWLEELKDRCVWPLCFGRRETSVNVVFVQTTQTPTAHVKIDALKGEVPQ